MARKRSDSTRWVQEMDDGGMKKMPMHKASMNQGMSKHSGSNNSGGSKAKLGSGGRFKALKKKLSKRKSVTNPGALAAYIGRKKYGARKFAQLGRAGRKGK